ncbi:MAG: cob(I)yrinic acid a,c-diamide adenosyltransferase [Planctomycetaceae bacterium]|nr:cob(I)yrinic acid a,c-diamide adenosyltransferase [Planctomycetaceae bacterium]
MVRLDRIYTRGGDQGMTSTGDGQRVSKLHPRIVAGGAVDETNSAIGMALSAGASSELNDVLIELQQFLFDLGADICVPLPAEGQSDLLPSRISVHNAEHLEQLIDRFTVRQAALNSFVLPGGSPAASHLHFARSVCRRAELEVLRLQETVAVNAAIAICLNRLSDLLFVLARAANDDGRKDVLWQPERHLDRA